MAYKGGGMAGDEAAQQQAMAAWGAWFGTIGDAVVDQGAPFGAAQSIGSDGSVSAGGAAALTGYTIVSADSLDDAVSLTHGCPIFAAGGSVEVYEAIPVM